MKRFAALIFTSILVLSACTGVPAVGITDPVPPARSQTAVTVATDSEPTGQPAVDTAVPTADTAVPAADTAVPAAPTASQDPQPTAKPTEKAEPVVELSPAKSAAEELAALIPPQRDDLRLAVAYRGLTDTSLSEPERITEPLVIGERQTFNIPNVVNNTASEIEAELFAVSDNAYLWFDTGPGSISPDQNEVIEVSQIFDEIYRVVVNQFGSERNPGIDGDPRLHIVHASPISLCGVTEENLDQCYLAGLVNSTDLLPGEIDSRSNEREMFVMNALRFGTDYYLGVLAHEFRHMIEDNYDKSDTDWEVEGSATLAAQLAGMSSGGEARANMFLSQPDQQLNSWTEEGTASYYGQGYLFNRYIFDQLGQDLYREFAISPLPGFHALDSVTSSAGLDANGEALWLDYLAAIAIHDHPDSPAKYQFQVEGIDTAAATEIESLPASFQEQLSQFAADFYHLPAGVGGIELSGSGDVSLLGTDPVSGEKYWFAQRANYSNPRLTYDLDLSDLDQATLNYDIYTDIEKGYDFAYVSVSLDDGRTWAPLVAEYMQGMDPEDNPAGSAFTNRFYTGRGKQWINETIDLTPFTGQNVLLRFEYVTDPILTYGGLALDNISVKELDFFDGAESVNEQAMAEGFVRVPSHISQDWHVQLISFEGNGPQVQSFPVDETGQVAFAFKDKPEKPSILIIAASAPTSLEKAEYELEIK